MVEPDTRQIVIGLTTYYGARDEAEFDELTSGQYISSGYKPHAYPCLFTTPWIEGDFFEHGHYDVETLSRDDIVELIAKLQDLL